MARRVFGGDRAKARRPITAGSDELCPKSRPCFVSAIPSVDISAAATSHRSRPLPAPNKRAGLGAAEADHGELEKMPIGGLAGPKPSGDCDRPPPCNQADRDRNGKLPPLSRRCLRNSLNIRVCREWLRRHVRDQITRECSAGDDQRKRQREKENADESRGSDANEQPRLQRAPADADRASTTITSTAALCRTKAPNEGDSSAEGVEQAQAQHDEGARQHEQNTGREPHARRAAASRLGSPIAASGPGSSMQKLSACRKRGSSIHFFSSTTMRCIKAI